MTCEHVHVGDACVTICGPSGVVVLREEDAGVRWCFGCRAHLSHTDRLKADAEPSYYGPWWVRECSGCGEDRTVFPGRSVEWL